VLDILIPILNAFRFYRQIFMRVSSGKFYGNPSGVNCTCAFRRADMKKGIALFVAVWTHQKCMNLVLYF